jgi:hypothetical protein
MDSSSSHNTQTANLIYDLYANLSMKTPPQLSKEYNGDIVTAIRGYPIICFYDKNGLGTEISYIGRYNFNLDKATPEPFGFEPKTNAENNEHVGYEVDADGNLILIDGQPHDII